MQHAGGVVLVLAALVAAGCAPAITPPPTPAATPAHLVVSYTQLPTSPNLAALAGGIFQQHGLDVDLRRIPQGAVGMQSLLAGDTQVAELGGPEALAVAANGADLVILANLDPVYVFKLMVPPAVTSLADLKGKKIGITNQGSVDATATLSGLRRLGLAPEDVTFVPVGPEDARVGRSRRSTSTAWLKPPRGKRPTTASRRGCCARHSTSRTSGRSTRSSRRTSTRPSRACPSRAPTSTRTRSSSSPCKTRRSARST
jgi:ABC-type taurine transport system substrate-binding protein